MCRIKEQDRAARWPFSVVHVWGHISSFLYPFAKTNTPTAPTSSRIGHKYSWIQGREQGGGGGLGSLGPATELLGLPFTVSRVRTPESVPTHSPTGPELGV